ncbi:hypothetical protein [Legionella fairfieldensis]|uniref:hypothetical protein n=1 Tax=Legionella fairfieldensis TaxID=45064 RepID=UPI00048CA66E|nr:hypothetical protein [Legionella fairfieldensis]
MPVSSKDCLLDNVKCSIIFAGQSPIPEFLDLKLIKVIKDNSNIKVAGDEFCGIKAEFLANNLQEKKWANNIKKLLMFNWLAIEQPDTPYRVYGLTTGATHHVLTYFEKEELFFACDLNQCPDNQDMPYLQIFVSTSDTGLYKLLNGIYAVKTLFLLPVDGCWVKILDEYKDTKVAEFSSVAKLDELTFSRNEEKNNVSTSIQSATVLSRYAHRGLSCFGIKKIAHQKQKSDKNTNDDSAPARERHWR